MMLHIKRRFFWFMKLTDMFDNTFATVLAGPMFWSAAYLRKTLNKKKIEIEIDNEIE